jgi:hypothetical protein
LAFVFSSHRVFITDAVYCGGLGVFAEAMENFFKNPKIGSATLSPNGKYVATTANIDGRMQLAVIDIETGAAKNIAGYKNLDIVRIRWISDERIVFNIIDRDGEQRVAYGGLYGINRDGTDEATMMEDPEHIRGRMDLATWVSQPRYMAMAAYFAMIPTTFLQPGCIALPCGQPDRQAKRN